MMNFAIVCDTNIKKWDVIRFAEELGYDRAYIPDSQMIWSDCYATLALAAVNTHRIKMGTGISSPGLRIAPVTAHSIATINELAPGRVFLGLGTGHTSMRLIGQDPMPLKEFREYFRVVRALLDGEEVDYTRRGKTNPIKFMHRDRHYINLDNRIPIYIAANGPKAIDMVAESADGWMITTADPNYGGAAVLQMKEAARKADRTLPLDFVIDFGTSSCVLRPGEKLTDERVINETGSKVAGMLHLYYEFWQYLKKDEIIPSFFARIWQDYVKHVDKMPRRSRFRYLHDGHFTFLQPEERRFITPEAIKAITLTGEPDEIIERIRAMEKVGFNELQLLPPADYQRKVFRDFAEYIIPAFR